MAETPAAAPANTKDTLLANIKALIKNTFDEEEPRGNNTASLAVHAAMAVVVYTRDCFVMRFGLLFYNSKTFMKFLRWRWR